MGYPDRRDYGKDAIVTQCVWLNMKQIEIARLLNVTSQTIRSRLFRLQNEKIIPRIIAYPKERKNKV